MHPIKYFWVLRALRYKLRLGKIKLPAYLGKPVFINRPKQIFTGGGKNISRLKSRSG